MRGWPFVWGGMYAGGRIFDIVSFKGNGIIKNSQEHFVYDKFTYN